MPKYTIGYASLTEAMPSVAYRTQTLIEAAAAHSADIDLIVRDNDLNDDHALANARFFAEQGVDLVIMFHINERLGSQLHSELLTTPIIAVDVPIPFAHYFGADNAYAGQLVGEALGHWVATHWDGTLNRLLILTDSRVTSVVRERTDNALAALRDVVRVPNEAILHLDGGSTTQTSYERTVDLLPRWAHHERIAVITANDEMAFGALQAFTEAGRENDVVLSGQGANQEIRDHLAGPNPRIIASTDYRLEQYGPMLIDLAVRILRKERVPVKTYVDHVCVTLANR
jgi:ribose transport system substrate-binding protein